MAKWRCKSCLETKKVVSGECPKCGPTQTRPLDAAAFKEAGVEPDAKPKEVEL